MGGDQGGEGCCGGSSSCGDPESDAHEDEDEDGEEKGIVCEERSVPQENVGADEGGMGD
ncbi:MAG TPA: hypothetical protein VNY51_12690 [Candidatus Dormibacteraeota bacterium]|jgi:hypothetical protein|nr:hypothetical protein [Candidatus Dormibacteraeota bacterium]